MGYRREKQLVSSGGNFFVGGNGGGEVMNMALEEEVLVVEVDHMRIN